ncbi:hypothetical protein LZ31DRAFT_628762 [Colletotrichum somersetense]|nr:hypothetical protein LZ31DRAFT_628762 [Colletotrichum somersetense]
MSSHFSPASDPARPSETGPDSRVKVPVNTSSTFVASLGSLALLFVALAASYLRPLLAPVWERISGLLFAPTPPAMPVGSSSPRQHQTGATRPSITAPSFSSLALVASGIPTKPSIDKSDDYSTDSPTPHTISNWDSTLVEDRLSSYSFTRMPTPSAHIPAALAEWDTSSPSTPAASVYSAASFHPLPATPVAAAPPFSFSPDPVLRKFPRKVTEAHFAVRGEELPPSWMPPFGPVSSVPPVASIFPLSMSPDPVLRKFARNVTEAHFAARGEELPASWTPPSFAHGKPGPSKLSQPLPVSPPPPRRLVFIRRRSRRAGRLF